MAKFNYSTLANLSNESSAVSTINANFAALQTVIETLLSRDGTIPNTMTADLDMNSNDVLNVNDLTITNNLTLGGSAIDAWNDLLSIIDVTGMAKSVYDPADIAEQLVGLTATQTLTNKTLGATTLSGNLDLDGNNLIVDVDGDSKLYEAADDDVRLQIGGTDTLFANTNGIGVGGSNAGNSIFEVHDSGYTGITIISAAGAQAFIAANSNSDVRIGSITNHVVTFRQNNSTRLRLLTGGGVSIDDGNNFTVDTDTLYVDATNDRVGINVTPEKALHIEGTTDPTIRLRETGQSTSSYFDLVSKGADRGILELINNSGTATIDLQPRPSDGTSLAWFRMFRETDTTGEAALYIYKGDNTGTANARISGNTNSYVCADNSNFGVGLNSPSVPLHVKGSQGFLQYIEGDNATFFVFETAGGGFEIGTVASHPYSFDTNSIRRMMIDAPGNILIGGFTTPPSGVANLALFNGIAPTGSVANGVILYSEDVSSSAELKVRDEAGNVTTLSPHNFSLISDGPSEDMAWSYYSKKGNKEINVDMLEVVRTLEELSGKKLVHTN